MSECHTKRRMVWRWLFRFLLRGGQLFLFFVLFLRKVGVIPNERWAWPRAPILLLVWQRLRPLETFSFDVSKCQSKVIVMVVFFTILEWYLLCESRIISLQRNHVHSDSMCLYRHVNGKKISANLWWRSSRSRWTWRKEELEDCLRCPICFPLVLLCPYVSNGSLRTYWGSLNTNTLFYTFS